MVWFARIACGLFLLVLTAAGPAPPLSSELSSELPAGLQRIGAARVVAVIDGDTVRLDDKRQVRLVGTQAPKLPLGRKNFKAWPLGPQAKAALEKLVLGRHVILYAGGAQMDRHGRTLAHLLRDDGLWVQGAMIRAGYARVYSFPDNRAAVREMLALEAAAREAKRGLWAEDYYKLRTPVTIHDHVGGYELVEGRVLKTATVKARSYLNFGADYKKDFTVTLDSRARRQLAKAGLKPADLAGRVIRVRGWVSWINGPTIEVTHPEQIELLASADKMGGQGTDGKKGKAADER